MRAFLNMMCNGTFKLKITCLCFLCNGTVMPISSIILTIVALKAKQFILRLGTKLYRNCLPRIQKPKKIIN